MNQPPKEITTAPEGYEWTGEVREPDWAHEPYAEWRSGQWLLALGQGYEPAGMPKPILRKVKPPTVTVELPREVASNFSKTHEECGSVNVTHRSIFLLADEHKLAVACREALAREDAE